MTRRVKSEEPRRSPYKATDEQIEFLKQRYGQTKMEELVKEYNEAFPESPITNWQIYRLNYKYGWKEKTKVGFRPLHVWTPEMIKFCEDNCKGHTYKEMAEMLTKEFGVDIIEEQVGSLYSRKGLTNGLQTAFHKGHIPMNKGKKWDEFLTPEQQERCRKGCYKKGNRPHTWRPVGTIIIRNDKHRVGKGYRWIKVQDLHGTDNFMLYARYVYEQHHNVKLKTSDLIVHLDGDPLNDNIENLMLVHAEENGILNKSYRGIDDPDLKKASVLTVRLGRKIKKIKEK